MNFKTIVAEPHAPIKAVRVTFERENDLMTRVYLTSQDGDCICVKLGRPGEGLEVLRSTPDLRPITEAIARAAEPDEAVNTSPAA